MKPFRQFIFGQAKEYHRPFSAQEIDDLIKKGREVLARGALPTEEQILALFTRLARAWSNPAYPRRIEALEALKAKSGLGGAFLDVIIENFPSLLSPETIAKKIEGELGVMRAQDAPVSIGPAGGRIMFRPAGQVLHVAPGNVFLGCIESLIDGIVTKNVNFLRMSSADTSFPVIFAESVRELDTEGVAAPRIAILWWEAGDDSVEGIFKREMDRIVFWGGYDALVNWKRGLGHSTQLVQHGPKMSFGVISRLGLESEDMRDLADRISLDMTMWEQKACNCPQMILIEKAASDDKVEQFLKTLAEGLEKKREEFPLGDRTDDENVEILRTRELALAKGIIKKEATRINGPKTLDWTIIYDEEKNLSLELSPLNRTIRVKRYSSTRSIEDLLKDRAFYLQTAGYALGEEEVADYAKILSKLGVTRLCRFGIMPIPTAGAPHDGSYALRDLTRVTVVE